MEIVSQKIIQIRQQHNWTQQEFAERCSLDLPSLQQLERCGNTSEKNVENICSALGINVKALSPIPGRKNKGLKTVMSPNPIVYFVPSTAVGTLLGFLVSYFIGG